MSAPAEQAQLADDAKANKLLVQINQQMVARDLIIERIRWLERKIEYRNKQIRRLSAKRTEALNFMLPL